MNDFAELKEKAKKTWSDFASMENFTGVAAPKLAARAGRLHRIVEKKVNAMKNKTCIVIPKQSVIFL